MPIEDSFQFEEGKGGQPQAIPFPAIIMFVDKLGVFYLRQVLQVNDAIAGRQNRVNEFQLAQSLILDDKEAIR
ncbi:MAG: hypothetical protein ACRD8U_17285 [Pyrinomonadaceae bacterium]